MKKLIPLFFIILITSIHAQKVIISPSYFEDDPHIMILAMDLKNDTPKLEKMINRHLYHEGFVFTKVQKIRQDNKKDELKIYLDEGKVSRIKIVGNRKISDRVIHNYCYFNRIKVFNKRIFQLQIKRLYNLKLFDSIDYTIDEAERSILITIVEKKRKFFEISGNYSEQYGVMPYLGFINRNLFKRSNIYMDINAEAGFWDELIFYRLNMNLILNKFYFDLDHRSGKTFIDKKSYSSDRQKIHAGRRILAKRNWDLFLFIPLENYHFYNTKEFPEENIINGWRYGLAAMLNYNNQKDVLEIREESHFNFSLKSIFYKKKYNYTKYNIDLKWFQGITGGFGIVYRNSTGYIWGDSPLDSLILIGGINQRGYTEGSYTTDLKFENSLEIEYELFFRILRTALFMDVSYFKKEPTYKTIISYGPGIILNIDVPKFHSFNIQTFYGIPLNKEFSQGNLYIILKKLFY